MSSLYLKLDHTAGGSVEDTVKDVAITATRLGIWCECTINGIMVFVPPGDDPEQTWKNYCRATEVRTRK